MRVLLSNAGRRTYMVEFMLDLARKKFRDLEVLVSDASYVAAAMNVDSDAKRILTPRVDAGPDDYIDALLRACEEQAIDAVIPLMDYELPLLASSRSAFSSLGTTVVVGNLAGVAMDKAASYRLCERAGIPTPRSALPGEPTQSLRLPLMSKPVLGSGSIGLQVLRERSEVPEAVPVGYILQEIVEGVEFGMDILNDLSANYVHSCLKQKLRMRSGETDAAEVLALNQFEPEAIRVSRSFLHLGNMDVDFIVDSEGHPSFIDFNPRFGGGYPFTHLAGSDYLSFLIESLSGIEATLPESPRGLTASKGISIHVWES